MKIEKVNDNQIRCTLTREDLATRELKISELAYGTEKAKNLFRDMMQQASFEFGFEAEDIPLMIEAIPLNSECIVLIITKVEDPEELDTRFSKFAPSVHDDDDENAQDVISNLADGADDVLDLFKKLHASRMKEAASADTTADTASGEPAKSKDEKAAKTASAAKLENLMRIFAFSSLNQLIKVAHLLADSYDGANTLYKDEKSGNYLLLINQSHHTPEEFAKVCNFLSEYGNVQRTLPSSDSYLEEHYTIITTDNALQSLALI